MKAWMFIEPGKPLELHDLPDPIPGPTEAVVEVRAAGLCHTDVSFMDGSLQGPLAFTPIVLGHEVAGVVRAVGEEASGFAVGDRVAISAMGDGKSGVVGTKNIGNGRHGGYATSTLTPASELIAIPDSVSFAQAAASTDAGMTCYHALFTRGGLQPGMKVGIIGLGGLGMTAARLAVLGQSTVYAADVNERVHAAALERGVKRVVKDVQDFAGLGLDLIVDFAGFGTTTAGAIEVIADGGRIVQVGLGRAESSINTHLLTLKQLELLGSLGGTPEDTANVLKYLASGDLRIATKSITFDAIPAGLETLRLGAAPGQRLVAEF